MHHLYMFDVRDRLSKQYGIDLVDLVDDDGIAVFHDNVKNLELLGDVSARPAGQPHASQRVCNLCEPFLPFTPRNSAALYFLGVGARPHYVRAVFLFVFSFSSEPHHGAWRDAH